MTNEINEPSPSSTRHPSDKPLSFDDGFAEGVRRTTGILCPENGLAELTPEYLAGLLKAMDPTMERVRLAYNNLVFALSDAESERHFAAIQR
jgi:hypothetical protein